MTPKPKAVPRRPILDPHRIGQLLRDIDEYQGSFSVKYALKLMPYLFVRSQELRNARWDEIDFDKAVWNIPAERMKMKSPHTVPLARQVVKLLTELHEWTGHTGLLFPSAQSNTRSITDVGLLNALRRMGYGRDEIVYSRLPLHCLNPFERVRQVAVRRDRVSTCPLGKESGKGGIQSR